MRTKTLSLILIAGAYAILVGTIIGILFAHPEISRSKSTPAPGPSSQVTSSQHSTSEEPSSASHPPSSAQIPTAPDPTATAPISVTTGATASKTVTYIVQPGDNLTVIANKFMLAGYQPLYGWNAQTIGTDPNLIYPGQVLVVAVK